MATPKNRSVQKAFRILRAFREPSEWLTSAELSRRAGLPEASGYRFIQTLEELGAVIRDQQGRYGPGMLLVSLSQYVEHDRLLCEIASATLQVLAEELDLIIHMGILHEDMVTYVAKAGTTDRICCPTQVGTQLEAYCSGLGKVLLAALPKHELQSFLTSGDLIALTPNTITERDAFVGELERVRRRGWALDDCETALDLRCVAVPVCDGVGRTLAAISCSDRGDRMTVERIEQVRTALSGAASQIGANIYRAGTASPFNGLSASSVSKSARSPRKYPSRGMGMGSASSH